MTGSTQTTGERLRGAVDCLGSLLEALFKCAPVFLAQALALYPLLAIGQGQEAMRGLLDPGPGGIAPFVFWCTWSFACALTLAFLFFLLDRWNYPASDGCRAFCRISVPAGLTLVLGLAWPVAADLSSQGATTFVAIGGLVNGAGTLALVLAVWSRTRPTFGRGMAWWSLLTAASLFVAFVAGSVLAFGVVCAVALALLCFLIRDDFRDSNPDFRPGSTVHPIGLGFAGVVVVVVLLLSKTSEPWRMFVGSPSIVVAGFAFFAAMAFLLTALLRLVPPVWRRLAWLALAILALVAAPINQERLRILPPTVEPVRPASHLAAWLRSRAPLPDSQGPYPVFIVAAEGGGARAAYWTATLLAGLEERYPGFTRHLYAISGVSGGSVGAAAYVSLVRDLPRRGARGCAPLEPNGLHGLRPCAAYLFRWDLLGPPLAGLLIHDLPFGAWRVQRGQALEEAMETAWFASLETGSFEAPFRDLWRDDPYGLPSLILNTTSVDTGERHVVSNLSTQGRLGTAPDVEAVVGGSLRLSTAVFLSARFPVISPEAIADVPNRGVRAWVDGGYFNNSGMAAVAQLLTSIEPVLRSAEFAGKVQPVVLVVSSSPPPDVAAPAKAPGKSSASVGGSLLAPLSVLQRGGQAHNAAYIRHASDVVGDGAVLSDLRPPAGSAEVALGWMLSAQSRCALDAHVNEVLNRSRGSQSIARLLAAPRVPPTSWTSCREAARP